MPAAAATTWFLPFLLAAGAALACGAALLAVARGRARERSAIRDVLAGLAPGEQDPLRAARRAVAEAARRDAALAEARAIVEFAPFGIVALDRMGRVLAMNPAACRMLGIARRPAGATLLIELVRAPELAALLAFARDHDRNAEAELVFQVGGARRSARTVIAPLASAATDTAFVVVLEDLTALRRLESVRSDFVANVSHELRTPVTNVRGYAETLLSSFDLEPQARSFLETIQRNATRLGAIIDDLLLLASLETPGSERPETAPVGLAAALRETIERHADAAERKRMTIACECPPGLRVQASAGLLDHAVGNLLENAVKYSPEGSRVEIAAREEGSQAVIEIRDQGPGIPTQHLPRIFERFYRVDRARSRDSGGTGLGLAIVKHVAQALGGGVEVESRTGVGTCFRLRLPLPERVPEPGATSA
jgi:two-component system phosphate regulon sensor histidine kinase PhoR